MTLDLEKIDTDCPACSSDWRARHCALCGGKGYFPIARGLRMYALMPADEAQAFLKSAAEVAQSEMVALARQHAEQRNKQTIAATDGGK